MAKKHEETLEQGLNRSAEKKGLTGAERHRYIGGALRNMGKAKNRPKSTVAKVYKAKSTTSKPAKKQAYEKPTLTKVPKKHSYEKPTMKKHEHIKLVARKNTEVSKARGKIIYSVYKEGNKTPHTEGLFSKKGAADTEAKIEQDMHNYPFGELKRGRLA